ncbi:hypothetical protein CspHIS471_0407850 [Cutaneotrichosporon sp. HIS471]|nr:hypothetical protein CspHIS471_0407850 [Cutaneotrichosporon sp. HIS471]
MIVTALVRGMIRGEVTTETHIDGVIDRAVERYNCAPGPIQDTVTVDSDKMNLELDELRKHTHATSLAMLDLDGAGIGYVYKSLGSALLLLRQAMRRVSEARSSLVAKAVLFEPLMTDLVMAGGDADTNACVAGALLGAYVGYTALPAHWRDGLRHGTWLTNKGEAVCRVLGVVEGGYEREEDTAVDGGRGMVSADNQERRWMELQARMAAENTAYLEKQKQKQKEKQKEMETEKDAKTRWFRR